MATTVQFGIHKDDVLLQDTFYRSSHPLEISEVDFGITEGLRSRYRQKQLVATGKSQTMNSRHLTGHAVDVVAYIGSQVSWEWPLYGKWRAEPTALWF